jgi:hypothetical protein
MEGGAMSEQQTRDRDVRLGGMTLGVHRHACAFFNSADEEDALLLPFLKDGLDHGDRGFCIIDPKARNEYIGRLNEAGIESAPLEEKGDLELRGWDDAYLRGGHFSQDAMIALIQEVLNTGRERGYPLTRLVAHMEWSREDRPGVDDLVEYETRLNHVLPKYPDPVICTYDTSKYDGGVIMDILRTHPLVVVGGVLRENPFFVEPDDFLRELRSRSSATDHVMSA